MRRRRIFVSLVVFAASLLFSPGSLSAQGDPTDTNLESASGGRVIRVGALATDGRVTEVPLEVYVARVLAGEGEPRAADAAQQALAIAIRTYALANLRRHGAYDLCDTTHCQVPRPATAASRRAALATAGQILTWRGAPAEVFYSASCGGRSEEASEVWPDIRFPYLQSHRDDVHDDDEPWTVAFTLGNIQQALAKAGFTGERLRELSVKARNTSGRVSRLQVAGLRPDTISGDQLRAAIGATQLRSTAFSLKRHGNSVVFTGRGFGHGVGMCVIGAGRRALRGEDAPAILKQYYPGLQLTRLEVLPAKTPAAPRVAVASPSGSAAALPASAAAAVTTARNAAIAVRVPAASAVTATELESLATRAHAELTRTLGVSVAPLTIQLHDTIESFRLATRRPWWVSAMVQGTSIDLAPAAVLAQRDGVEAAVRVAVAELLVSSTYVDRPLWVRAGAARYFGRLGTAPVEPRPAAKVRCPSDAELVLAVSVAAQRDAEARAEACFARELARAGDWRAVR
jgi:SpoIID/LytB domain protein